METPALTMSAADIHRLGIGKKRRVNLTEWKDRARKCLRDAGKPYVNRRGQQKEGKSPPKEVSGITVYVHCINLMLRVTFRGGRVISVYYSSYRWDCLADKVINGLQLKLRKIGFRGHFKSATTPYNHGENDTPNVAASRRQAAS